MYHYCYYSYIAASASLCCWARDGSWVCWPQARRTADAHRCCSPTSCVYWFVYSVCLIWLVVIVCLLLLPDVLEFGPKFQHVTDPVSRRAIHRKESERHVLRVETWSMPGAAKSTSAQAEVAFKQGITGSPRVTQPTGGVRMSIQDVSCSSLICRYRM